MKTVSIPFNDRYEMLRRVVDSLDNALGIEDWTVVFNREPGGQISKPSKCREVIVSSNTINLGCWENTFLAAKLAMTSGSDYNLYLEDDYLIARDTLTMVDAWSVRPDSHASVLCLRRPHNQQDFSRPDLVQTYRTGLFGCGFAWRKELWPLIREVWWRRAPMWDIAMEQLNVPQWRPLVNRSHGIGTQGTHTSNGHDLNLFGPCYSGRPITHFVFE